MGAKQISCHSGAVVVSDGYYMMTLDEKEQAEVARLSSRPVQLALLLGGPRHGEVIDLPRDRVNSRQVPSVALPIPARPSTTYASGGHPYVYQSARYNYMDGPVVRLPSSEHAYIYQAEELESANVNKRIEQLESSKERHLRELHAHEEELTRVDAERQKIYEAHGV